MESVGQPYRKTKAIEGRFDAIVIGSGMGGLSAASILAQEGLKILLLEQNSVIGGMTQTYSRAGYRWSIGMHYIGDVGSEKATGWKLFDYVTAGGLEWNPMPNIYNRMAVGDKIYDIPAGEKAYTAMLKDHFPQHAEAIDQYMHLIPAVSKSSRLYFAQKVMPERPLAETYEQMCGEFHSYSDRLTYDVLSELFEGDDEIIAVLCANWGDYSLEPSRSSFAMHCMLNKHYMNGGWYPAGGGKVFADLIAPIIEKAGGALYHSADVAEILVVDGKTEGVKLTSGEEVHCPCVISNAGVQNTFGRLIKEEAVPASTLKSEWRAMGDTYCLVGLNIGLNKSGAELGFTPANIWAHPDKDLVGNLQPHKEDFSAPFPWTFITFPSVKDPDWDAEFKSKATVEMYAYTYFDHFAEWAGTRWHKRGDAYLARKEEIKTRLLEELFRYVPAARDAIDHVEVSTPLTYETFAKREKGGFMGLPATPDRFKADWLRAQTPIKGLYLTGQDVTSDGVIGALVGGVLCSSAVVGKNLMQTISTR